MLLTACSGEPEPLEPRSIPSESRGIDTGWQLSDVQLKTLDDPVADVVWVVTYDARARTEETPEPLECTWFMFNRDDEIVRQGLVEVTRTGNDLKAGDGYPDEIPGQPVKAEMSCE